MEKHRRLFKTIDMERAYVYMKFNKCHVNQELG